MYAQCLYYLNYFSTFLKLSVKLNLHTARLPIPDIESENAVGCEATIDRGVVYIFRRKYFTLNSPRVTALSKYSLISVRNCKGPFRSSKSECESAKRSKNNRKRSRKTNQTSKKIFAFAFVFARCEWALSDITWR